MTPRPPLLPSSMMMRTDAYIPLLFALQNGKKVVSGSQEGVLFLYSWGYWNDCSDRFPGHPNSIDTIVKVRLDEVRRWHAS